MEAALNVPVSEPIDILMEKASEISKSMGLDFKQQKAIVFRITSVESAVAPKQDAETRATSALQVILKKYAPADIFNTDETGLFFQCLPNKTLSLKDENCAGRKKFKNRLSIFITANMEGIEKLPPLIIGKAKKAKIFQECQNVAVGLQKQQKGMDDIRHF